MSLQLQFVSGVALYPNLSVQNTSDTQAQHLKGEKKKKKKEKKADFLLNSGLRTFSIEEGTEEGK